MFDSTAEKLELHRLVAAAGKAGVSPPEKSDLLRNAATEARRWCDYHTRKSIELLNYEGGNNDGCF